jgi:hypothetical protein
VYPLIDDNLVEDKKLQDLITNAYTLRGVYDEAVSWINVVPNPDHERVARIRANLEKSLKDLVDYSEGTS